MSKELKIPLICFSCGYSLRGLTIPDFCPECGTDPYTRRVRRPTWLRVIIGVLWVALWLMAIWILAGGFYALFEYLVHGRNLLANA